MRDSGDSIWFSQLDVFLSYRREGVITSFGIGPTYTRVWEDWEDAERDNLGASIYLAILQDKLRFTLGTRSADSDEFVGESIYLSVSVMDIPGIVYWLTKGN